MRTQMVNASLVYLHNQEYVIYSAFSDD